MLSDFGGDNRRPKPTTWKKMWTDSYGSVRVGVLAASMAVPSKTITTIQKKPDDQCHIHKSSGIWPLLYGKKYSTTPNVQCRSECRCYWHSLKGIIFSSPIGIKGSPLIFVYIALILIVHGCDEYFRMSFGDRKITYGRNWSKQKHLPAWIEGRGEFFCWLFSHFCTRSLYHPCGICFLRCVVATSITSLTGLVFGSYLTAFFDDDLTAETLG